MLDILWNNLISKIILKPEREKSVLHRHPWIFSGAIANIYGSPESGETVRVHDSEDHFLCWAAFNPSSQISGRIWSWDEWETIDEDFFKKRIRDAVELRHDVCKYTNAVRLVYAESDGLPGLILDRYGGVAVIQLLSAGAERWKESIVNACVDVLKVSDIYERSDVEVRRLEDLPERTGTLRGKTPPEDIIIDEHGNKYKVNVMRGQKTGFYLDQRGNRLKLSDLSADRNVLDCFSYTGAFSVTALKHGARSLTAVDASSDALGTARENLALNKLSDENVKFISGDVFHELRVMRDRDQSFDLIILDPPKFAPTKSAVQKASRGYKDINLLAFKLLRPGGYLVTFSCSGAIDESLFQKIIAGAALDAGVNASIVERLHQASDHPVGLNFPEGAYLKGFVIYKFG